VSATVVTHRGAPIEEFDSGVELLGVIDAGDLAERAKDTFIQCLITFCNGLKRGHATDPTADLTRLRDEASAIKVEKQIELTVSQGANAIYGGTRNGAAMDVTIIDNVTRDMDIAKDMEVFGPVIPISPSRPMRRPSRSPTRRCTA
jgi:acyl-CoA reductase-like NAD-dependent aldehyde dehydrogenase